METPILIGAPAPELHIDPVAARGGFLHTSPELCMKRLLACGFPRIYQITRCFRDAERGNLHLPEFTMLEWYRAGAGYRELMVECASLINHVAHCCGLGARLTYAGGSIALDQGLEVLTVAEAFERFSPVTLKEAISLDIFEQSMAEHIEPRLGVSRPTFLCDYPISMAALARPRPDDPLTAERFELYLGGLEIANGFSELTDAIEQRRRFMEDRQARKKAGKTVAPMPEAFLSDLCKMPESAGIALGVDRLVMLLGDYSKIDDVVAFTPEEVAD